MTLEIGMQLDEKEKGNESYGLLAGAFNYFNPRFFAAPGQ